MTRIKGWEAQLAKSLHEAKTTPFVWGEFDCSLFACNVVRDITGTDIAHDFRGTYTNAIGAYRRIREFAGGGLMELAEKRAAEFGMPVISPMRASRGDIVLVHHKTEDALGIIGLDSRFVKCVGHTGLIELPVSCVTRAWRVG
jgi:hypothetical protein